MAAGPELTAEDSVTLLFFYNQNTDPGVLTFSCYMLISNLQTLIGILSMLFIDMSASFVLYLTSVKHFLTNKCRATQSNDFQLTNIYTLQLMLPSKFGRNVKSINT